MNLNLENTNYDFFNEVIAWSSEHWLKLKEASFTAKQ